MIVKWIVFACFLLFVDLLPADTLPYVPVEGQPLAANVQRLVQSLEYLGHPLPTKTLDALRIAIKDRDAHRLQALLNSHMLCVVSLNPEARVKVAQGTAAANLQQAGYTPQLVKVINISTVTRQLKHQ